MAKKQITLKEAHVRILAGLPVLTVETRDPQTGRIEFRYFVEE